jgi:aminopeptidase N
VRQPQGHAGSARLLLLAPSSVEQGWRLPPADGQPIEAGRHTLRVDCAGRVSRSGAGLFPAEHRVEGEARQMLATQFQAIDARCVFPGFDESAFRARFELTVRAPLGFQVLANMPLAEQRDEGATTVHRFAPTPPMPSCLLAMAVGQFDVLAGEADGVPPRIFTAPGQQPQASDAMEVSQQVLPGLSRHFGLPSAQARRLLKDQALAPP